MSFRDLMTSAMDAINEAVGDPIRYEPATGPSIETFAPYDQGAQVLDEFMRVVATYDTVKLPRSKISAPQTGDVVVIWPGEPHEVTVRLGERTARDEYHDVWTVQHG